MSAFGSKADKPSRGKNRAMSAVTPIADKRGVRSDCPLSARSGESRVGLSLKEEKPRALPGLR